MPRLTLWEATSSPFDAGGTPLAPDADATFPLESFLRKFLNSQIFDERVAKGF